jgi:carboxymethylenebutenolidase
MHTEKLTLDVNGEKMPAYLAVPEGNGPFPAVIVYQEIFGLTAHMRDVCERLAKEGYVAIAPDIHHRAAEPWFEYPYNNEGMQKGMGLIGKLTQAGAIADATTTINFLRARKDVNGNIGCMGFCIGGHVAYLTATATDVKATASFYGGGIAAMGLGVKEPTVTRTKMIKGKIICFFGAQDSMIPESQVATIKKALEEAHVRHEIVAYPDVGHAFFRDVDARVYNAKNAADAWERTKRLFAEELR